MIFYASLLWLLLSVAAFFIKPIKSFPSKKRWISILAAMILGVAILTPSTNYVVHYYYAQQLPSLAEKDGLARFYMGKLYIEGKYGYPTDYEEAYYWLQRVIGGCWNYDRGQAKFDWSSHNHQGRFCAKDLAKVVEKKLSPEKINAIKKRLEPAPVILLD